MLKEYKKELEKITNNVSHILNDIKKANELILEAAKNDCKESLNKAKELLRNMSNKTTKIDNEIVIMMAKYAPEARDLRLLVAFLKMTTALNRMAINTKNLIKGFFYFCQEDGKLKEIKELYIAMHKEVLQTFNYLLAMLKCEDSDEVKELYNQIVVNESKLDDYYATLEEKLITKSSDLESYKHYSKLLSYLRKAEKIGDRAVLIASLLLFAKVGGELI